MRYEAPPSRGSRHHEELVVNDGHTASLPWGMGEGWAREGGGADRGGGGMVGARGGLGRWVGGSGGERRVAGHGGGGRGGGRAWERQ